MKDLHFILLLFFAFPAAGQETPPPPANWHLLDWETDGYPGVSLEKAYRELLADKAPGQKIIVAVIDDGLDYQHPDLKGMVWTNAREVPDNHLDDDGNGYPDDVYGWNFIGDMEFETFEYYREFVRLRPVFSDQSDTGQHLQDSLQGYWESVVQLKEQGLQDISRGPERNFHEELTAILVYWQHQLDTSIVYLDDMEEISFEEPLDSAVISRQNSFVGWYKSGQFSVPFTTLNELVDDMAAQVEASQKRTEAVNTFLDQDDPAYFRTKTLGDDPYKHEKKVYGNNKTFPQTGHGTMVSGIIAAIRDNDILPQGISNHVAILPVRIFIHPNMDEWDKDVANAIRYAVDNGARVINMSFGKTLSPQKQWVDEAVRYAEAKGVLLVHAAGNGRTDTDSTGYYPSPYFPDGERAQNLLTVGASTFDSSLVASFSNYGAETVDIFAPGVQVTSTSLNNGVQPGGGTSAATPVVAGIAALIWSYYPDLTYRQVRQCIEGSAMSLDIEVNPPGKNMRVPFKSLSRTGGIVNAYRALQLAESMHK